MSLGTDGTSERVIGTLVSGNYFDVLGTRPALGRFFRDDEDQVPGERPVVVLSHALWTQRFNSDPAILDRPLRLNNREFAVVGVAEAGFQGSSMIGTDLWAPMAMVQVVRGRADSSMLDRSRAASGTSRSAGSSPACQMAQAKAELNTLNEAYKKAEPNANQHHTINAGVDGTHPRPGADAVPRVHRFPVRADRRAAGDRVQQRRGHAAGARGDAAPRNGDAARGRRRTRTVDPPAADRNDGAVRRRRGGVGAA